MKKSSLKKVLKKSCKCLTTVAPKKQWEWGYEQNCVCLQKKLTSLDPNKNYMGGDVSGSSS